MHRIRCHSGDRQAKAILAIIILVLFSFGVVYLYDAALKEEDQKKLSTPKKKPQSLEELCKDPELNRFADELYYGNKNKNGGVMGDFNSYLNKMSPNIRFAVKEIRINDDYKHYNTKDTAGGNVIGHYCPYLDDGTICVKSDNIFWSAGNIYHEATHAYWNQLRRNRDPFTHNWQFVPGKPISGYGARSPEENIAELVANFHLELNCKQSAFTSMSRYIFDRDHRKQFVALRDNWFITDSDYFRFLNKKGF